MTQILTVDIGNSFTKIALFIDGKLSSLEHFPTENDLELFAGSDGPLTDTLLHTLDGVVIASVVPAVTQSYQQIFQTTCNITPLILDRETLGVLNTGKVSFSHYAPGQLGADRVANSLAGFSLYGEKLMLAVDCGTATTFDMVTDDGLYIGGAICPGPRKFQSLVHSNVTAQLFEVDVFTTPPETPGMSTETGLQNGLYYGYKGAILEITGNLLQHAGWPLSKVNIVFTGGYAKEVRDMVAFEMAEAHIDRELTLKGLELLWNVNRKSASMQRP